MSVCSICQVIRRFGMRAERCFSQKYDSTEAPSSSSLYARISENMSCMLSLSTIIHKIMESVLCIVHGKVPVIIKCARKVPPPTDLNTRSVASTKNSKASPPPSYSPTISSSDLPMLEDRMSFSIRLASYPVFLPMSVMRRLCVFPPFSYSTAAGDRCSSITDVGTCAAPIMSCMSGCMYPWCRGFAAIVMCRYTVCLSPV
mmetsp:Transcript_8183/g.25228  ORF Transcript_8183/g.25228 Transcript_8183/m.25228 type:complete len:201 (-) Transcript_8183:11-613(-)